MKWFAAILFVLFLSSLANAADFTFIFKMKGDILTLKVEGNNYESAFDRAALMCFKHFKRDQFLTEEKGLDIIDVCANPRNK